MTNPVAVQQTHSTFLFFIQELFATQAI